MKKSYLFAAATTILLAACANGEFSKEQVALQVKAGFSTTATRAVGVNWNKDNIGISVIDNTNAESTMAYVNVPYSTTSTSDVAAFSAVGDGILFPIGYTGTATFSAYGPYDSSITGELMNIDTKSNNDSSDSQEKKLDILFAKGATATLTSPAVEFVGETGFSRKMAQLNFSIKTVKDGDFTASIADATAITLGGLKHKATFNIKTGEIKLSDDAAVSDWDIKSLNKSVDGDTYTYSLIVLPQTLTSALPITITIGSKSYTNKTSIKPDLTAGGKSYTYSINVQGKSGGIEVSGCTVADWDAIDGGSGDAYED